MRSAVMGAVRKSAMGTALLDQSPRRVELSDGSRFVVPRRVARLFEHWESQAATRAESLQSYAAYEGGDFVDVGAYHGWYSWLLAPKARPGDSFVSLEPDLSAYPSLLHNLSVLAAAFPRLAISALPKPVGDGRPAEVTFPLGEEMHPRVGSGAGTGDGPRTVAVDTLVAEMGIRPTFVKVDVEGAELYVVQGMRETLREFRPTVMLELHPLFQPEGVRLEDVAGVLREAGYTSRDLDVSEVAIRQVWS
ncbi:MAG TPA: FkbM family methyltransferase [Longimicrobiaceae bacterium]|nr:FkbM family methyltransferase [Longimicrobiaceae bacterium]